MCVFFRVHVFVLVCMCVHMYTGQVSDEHCSALVQELVVKNHMGVPGD